MTVGASVEHFAPRDLAEAEHVMRELHTSGARLNIVGAGTQLGEGYPGEPVGAVVETRHLARLIE